MSKRKGSTVVLASSNDATNLELVAKLSKSNTLEIEADVLRFFRESRGKMADEFCVKFYDYFKNFDRNTKFWFLTFDGTE